MLRGAEVGFQPLLAPCPDTLVLWVLSQLNVPCRSDSNGKDSNAGEEEEVLGADEAL